MQDIITVRGFVATDPALRSTASGTTVVGFRLATTERRFDRETGAWADAHTNWYSVSAFGQLGANTAQSVKKGNPVIVTGRLRVRDWSTEERSGTSVDVVADAVGLDLGYGASAFMRNQRSGRGVEAEQGEAGQAEQGAARSSRPGDGEDATGIQEGAQDPGFRTPLPEAFRERDVDGSDEGHRTDVESDDQEVEDAYVAA